MRRLRSIRRSSNGQALSNEPPEKDGQDGADRRVAQRLPITLRVEYDTRDGFLHDYTANISRGGTLIHTQRPLQVGEQLQLTLSFPGLLRDLTLSGVVRWVRPPDGDGVRPAGVEFLRGDDQAWERLQALVDRILASDTDVVAPSSLRMLLVEDNELVARLVRRGFEGYLRRSGASDRVAFEMTHVDDGQRAIEQLEAEIYDLVVIDIRLPGLDGAQVIRMLRADPRHARTPVIAVSADASARPEALGAGADVFMDKPLRLGDLTGVLHGLLAAMSVAS